MVLQGTWGMTTATCSTIPSSPSGSRGGARVGARDLVVDGVGGTRTALSLEAACTTCTGGREFAEAV